MTIDRRILLGALVALPFAGCDRAEQRAEAKPPPLTDILPPPPENLKGLVELIKLDPTLRLDIRYATANNFTKRVLYQQARAFLQEDAADALIGAHRALKPRGLGLTIFDGYRPERITQLMWDVTPPAQRNFVANPKEGSRHNRGCAVDLTLHELETGKPLPMPSGYDEFSPRAAQDFMDAPAEALANRALLRQTMEAHGFDALAHEWWHYDYKNWRDYPLLDVDFSEI